MGYFNLRIPLDVAMTFAQMRSEEKEEKVREFNDQQYFFFIMSNYAVECFPDCTFAKELKKTYEYNQIMEETEKRAKSFE